MDMGSQFVPLNQDACRTVIKVFPIGAVTPVWVHWRQAKRFMRKGLATYDVKIEPVGLLCGTDNPAKEWLRQRKHLALG